MNLPPDAHTREVFYVGGEYVTNSGGEHSLRGQVYVEHLTPVGRNTPVQQYPLVLIPGGGRTGVASRPFSFFLLSRMQSEKRPTNRSGLGFPNQT